MRAASNRFEFGKKVVQMDEGGIGKGVAFLQGQGQPGFLPLLVLDDGKQLRLSGLLVAGVERHVLDVEFPGEAESSVIVTLDDELAVLVAFGFVGAGDHLRGDFKRWR